MFTIYLYANIQAPGCSGLLVFIIKWKANIYLNKSYIYFLKIHYRIKFHDPTLSEASVSPNSEIRKAAMPV
jgi:hypothetical protein